MVATGLPTRSSIQAWDVQHLTDAADHWEGTADHWENASLQVWQESHGLNWEGQARDALVERVTNDKTIVMSKADQLREAATIARQGAGNISAAQRRVLYAMEDAHNAGFLVGEDLSVTDTRTSKNPAELAARQAQAQTLSADIRERAAQLVGLDTEVGGNITGAAGDVGATTFTETPVAPGGKKPTIQMAGHGFKQDPQLPTPPVPQPDPPAVKLPPEWGQQPPQVITAAPPPAAPGPPTTITGTPLCPGDKILGHLLEILAGGALVGVSGVAEAPSLGTSTAGILGGGSLIYNGIDGLETCP
jgi:hypothetical protein